MPDSIQPLTQTLAHVLSGLPDLHLGPLRVELNFHLHSGRKKQKVGTHTHLWWDVTMLGSGGLDYLADGKKISLRKNQVVIFPEGVEHSWTSHAVPLLLESYMLGVCPQNPVGERLLGNIRRRIEQSGYCFALSPRLRQLRAGLWTAAQEKPAGALQAERIGQLIQMFVVQLFANLFGADFTDEFRDAPDPLDRQPGNVKLVIRMEEYLRNHLADDIRIDSLQKQFGYSHRHLSRIFKEQTGSSIQHYLLTKRIRTACDLLINSGVRTKEAAYMVGFSDVSYFCRIFREQMRFTPQQYQEYHREKT